MLNTYARHAAVALLVVVSLEGCSQLELAPLAARKDKQTTKRTSKAVTPSSTVLPSTSPALPTPLAPLQGSDVFYPAALPLLGGGKKDEKNKKQEDTSNLALALQMGKALDQIERNYKSDKDGKKYITDLESCRSAIVLNTSPAGKQVLARVDRLLREARGQSDPPSSEEAQYVQELQQVADEGLLGEIPNREARLVKVLGQLAALRHKQGQQKGDPAQYTEAAVLYQ